MNDPQLDGRRRENIDIGAEVDIIQKKDQQSGNLTTGFVKRILTNSSFHPHGIKVLLDTGEIGRVKSIIEEEEF